MINYEAYSNVSNKEIQELFNRPKMKGFVKLMNFIQDNLSSHVDWPDTWLFTSINFDKQGNLRYPKDPSHHDSLAIDLIPVKKGNIIQFDIPLNRNMLYMSIFFTAFNKLISKLELPIIAFESEHLHVDCIHTPMVCYLNAVRETLDKRVFDAAEQNEFLKEAIHDKSLITFKKILL